MKFNLCTRISYKPALVVVVYRFSCVSGHPPGISIQVSGAALVKLLSLLTLAYTRILYVFFLSSLVNDLICIWRPVIHLIVLASNFKILHVNLRTCDSVHCEFLLLHNHSFRLHL